MVWLDTKLTTVEEQSHSQARVMLTDTKPKPGNRISAVRGPWLDWQSSGEASIVTV